MEKFDLEKWQSGDYDAVTRDGKQVRILCVDKKSRISEKQIVVLISSSEDNEYVLVCRQDGKIYGMEEDDNDIVLVKKKWQPKDNDEYYYIDDTLEVTERTYYDSPELSYDSDRVKIGNYFKTKEEAEAMVEKMKELLKTR